MSDKQSVLESLESVSAAVHQRIMRPIPVGAAKLIADTYGYDQVIIIARKVGDMPVKHGEHCTTYGVSRIHCDVAAKIGDFLKYKVMGWSNPSATNDGSVE